VSGFDDGNGVDNTDEFTPAQRGENHTVKAISRRSCLRRVFEASKRSDLTVWPIEERVQ
jgi:hypothetical protein